MIYAPVAPIHELYELVRMAEADCEQDTEPVDYMATFYAPDESDTETDAEQQRRDKAWVF